MAAEPSASTLQVVSEVLNISRPLSVLLPTCSGSLGSKEKAVLGEDFIMKGIF